MDSLAILVIAEDRVVLNVIHNVFTGAGRIVRVPRGRSAMLMTEEYKIDLAIVSHDLPHIDGFKLSGALRRNFPTLPIILVAAAPTKDTILAALRAGASDFCEKPLCETSLHSSVQRLCNVSPTKTAPAVVSDHDSPICTPAESVVPQNVNGRSLLKHWLGNLRDAILTAYTHIVDNQQVQFMFAARAPLARPWHGEKRNGAPAVPHEGLTITSPERTVTPTPEANGLSRQAQTAAVEPPASAEEPLCVEVFCLGKFRVVINGRAIDSWPSKKGKLLLAYLLVNHKRRHSRDLLMETFWPDSCPESARNSLNVAMHGIRRRLHEAEAQHEHLLFQNECYFMNPELEIRLDLEEFTRLWKSGQQMELRQGLKAAVAEYERAAAMYEGDFLEEDLYDGWATSQRENLKEIYLFLLDRISRYYSGNGRPALALDLCETILSKDSCREDIYRRLMICYSRLGQRDKALKQFKRCTEALRRELEVEPGRTTHKLYEQIKQNFAADKNGAASFSKN